MQKASFGGVATTTRNRWCNIVPGHAPVDVFEAIALPVTLELSLRAKIQSTASIFLNQFDDSLYLGRPSFWKSLKRISLTNLIQLFEGVANRLSLTYGPRKRN